MNKSTEKCVKRWLKNKISICLATLVVFSITGAVTFAATVYDVDWAATGRLQVNQDMEKVENRVTTLEGKVGDASAGLVKDVTDLKTTVGDASAGLVKDVANLKTETAKLNADNIFIKNNTFNQDVEVKGTLGVDGHATLSNGATISGAVTSITSANTNKVISVTDDSLELKSTNDNKITLTDAGISTIVKESTEAVNENKTVTVNEALNENSKNKTVTVSEDLAETSKNKTVTVNEALNENSKNKTVTVSEDLAETSKNKTVTVNEALNENSKNKTVTVSEDSTETVNGKKNEIYNNSLETTVTGDSTEVVTNGNKLTEIKGANKTITNRVNGGAELVMSETKNQFKKSVYIGSQPVLTDGSDSSLVLDDVDAIQIGKNVIVDKEAKARKNIAGAGKQNIALGYGNNVNTIPNKREGLGVGHANTVKGNESSAIGTRNSVVGNESSAIGTRNSVTGDRSTAVGYGNEVSGNRSGAFGDPNINSGHDSYIVGNNNTIEAGADKNFILGNDVTIKSGVTSSVALGDGSVVTHSNEVSVGAPGRERKVTNVADGRIAPDSTEAVNGRQLDRIDRKINQVGALSAAMTGADLSAVPVGKVGVAAGVGTFSGGANAVAVGVGFAPTENFKVNAKIAVSQNYRTAALGATYYIDLR